MNNSKIWILLLIGVVGVCMMIFTRGSITVNGDSHDTLRLEIHVYNMLCADTSTDTIERYISEHGYTWHWQNSGEDVVLYIGDGLGTIVSSRESGINIWSRLF